MEPERVVHILLAGWPLCGFSRELPSGWPKGHLWVPVSESAEANCPGCVREKKDRAL
jgi:hypothetical protein